MKRIGCSDLVFRRASAALLGLVFALFTAPTFAADAFSGIRWFFNIEVLTEMMGGIDTRLGLLVIVLLGLLIRRLFNIRKKYKGPIF